MANVSDKELKNLKKQLDEFNKKRDPKLLERRIKAETQGKSGIESLQIENQIREEWRMATEKTTGFMSGFFEGLVGKDLGSVLSKKYAKAKTEDVERAQNKFKTYFEKSSKEADKKANVAAKKVVSANRDIKNIKDNILSIQRSVQTIQKSLTGKSTPEIKPGYRFDPRMAGGGRYVNEATSRIVSKKEAISAGKTEALTKAIEADEDPMIRLADTLEQIFKSLGQDNKSVHDKLDDIEDKIESMKSSNDDGGLDLDIDRRRRTRPRPKGRSRFSRALRRGKLGGLKALRAARTFAGTSAGTATIAATGAVAITAAGAYALDRGMTKVGTEAKGKMDVLQSKYGLKTIYKNGMAVGYEVQGKKYGLNDLPQEYKDLIDAYGPGDKRSFSAREALKRIKANPEKYKALEIGAKPKAAPVKTATPPVAGGAAPAPTTPPNIQAAAGVGGATPGVAGALTTAATAPAAAAGAPAPAAPAQKGPEVRLGPAAAARGKIDRTAGKNAAIAAAAKAGITGPHLAQFLAQLDHESGHFTRVEENLRYSAKRLRQIFPKYYKSDADAEADANQPQAIANRVYANRMGNGPPESGDGYRYRGRGLIQLTGKDNYKRFGAMIGMDLVSNPDAAGALGTAADIAAAFYKKNVMDKGIEATDTKKVTKAINGGSIGLSDRESLFASYMKDPASMQPSAMPAGVGPEPQPSMYAKGQDQKVPGGGGGAPEEKQQMVASAQTQAPKAAPAAAPAVTPVPNQTGAVAAQESKQMATNQMVASTTPAQTTVVNNNGGGQQPTQAPKQPLPKASSRPSDNSFNRALAKDYSHPTSFTSVAPV